MKALIILSLTVFSFNVFSAEVGQDLKGECKFSTQTEKREAKPLVSSTSESSAVKAEPAKTISK